MEQVIYGNIRVTFLGDGIVRLERSFHGKFCDRDTFFVPARAEVTGECPAYTLEENVICFGDFELYLPAEGKSLSGLRLERNGRLVYRYRRLKNSGELPPPQKTPEVFALSDCPRIFLPRGGYSVRRRGQFIVRENVEDVYLLFAEGDPKKLRRLYVELTGRSELVRLATLGSWNSKYYAYSEEEAKKVIEDYEKYDIPLDNLVIDTDWRHAENGIGYDVNEALFPDMGRFLAFAHAHGVEVMFNDHPEPQGEADVFDGREIAYREKNLRALLSIGLDTWWYDRNWMTHLISPTAQVQWETLGLYLFHDVTKRYYQDVAKNRKVYRRPVVMGNVVEISNGDYKGISDSASHRYGIQWTGDTESEASSLAREVTSLVRCSDNCIPYMNSDCGGHVGNPDKEQFIRWMQYGALSPVLRPHCTKAVLRPRDPWVYDDETLQLVREYVLLRYRLLPYIYANAYEAYRTGVGVFRSLALEYPNERRAVRRDEYLLGKNLLIAPIAGIMPVPVAEACYTAPVEVTFFRGREWKGKPIATAVWKELRMDLKDEPPMAGVPAYDFSAKVRTKLRFEEARRLYIRSDDGASVWIDGKCVLEDKTTHAASFVRLVDLEPGVEHTVEIDYFQALGEAFLGLYSQPVAESSERTVYLPTGRWVNAFDGTMSEGRHFVRKQYALSDVPLYVRLGALIPLAHAAQTTKQQSWRELTFDFFPDRESSDEGYLYEDDGETTAYRKGACAMRGYTANYLPDENAFGVTFAAEEGNFRGARRVKEHVFTLRYHCLGKVGNVRRVTLNGKEVPFEIVEKTQGMPFRADGGAPDAQTLSVRFTAKPSEQYIVKFYLGK